MAKGQYGFKVPFIRKIGHVKGVWKDKNADKYSKDYIIKNSYNIIKFEGEQYESK